MACHGQLPRCRLQRSRTTPVPPCRLPPAAAGVFHPGSTSLHSWPEPAGVPPSSPHRAHAPGPFQEGTSPLWGGAVSDAEGNPFPVRPVRSVRPVRGSRCNPGGVAGRRGHRPRVSAWRRDPGLEYTAPLGQKTTAGLARTGVWQQEVPHKAEVLPGASAPGGYRRVDAGRLRCPASASPVRNPSARGGTAAVSPGQSHPLTLGRRLPRSPWLERSARARSGTTHARPAGATRWPSRDREWPGTTAGCVPLPATNLP